MGSERSMSHEICSPVLVSLSYAHPQVDADDRAPLAIPETELTSRLGWLKEPPEEVALLSTCLRHEVLAIGADQAALEEFVRITSATNKLPHGGVFRSGRAVIDHMFRVTAGLHSPVIGEPEILGQVRRAHRYANKAGTVGPILDKLFREAIRTSREARELFPEVDTGSIAGIAAEWLLDKEPGRLLLIGAGTMANAVFDRVQAIIEWDVIRITRRPERVAGGALSFDALQSELTKADVALTAVTSSKPLLSADLLAAVRAQRQSPLTIIDIGMPANVDHNDLTGYEYVGLDDLACDQRHKRATEEAEALIDIRAYEVYARILNSALTPMIQTLRQKAERVANEELVRALARLGSPNDQQRTVIEQMVHTLTNRLLHDPLEYLSTHPDAVSQSQTASDILGIGR